MLRGAGISLPMATSQRQARVFSVWGVGMNSDPSRDSLDGLGFRVWGLGLRVWGLGFRVWGLGFRI